MKAQIIKYDKIIPPFYKLDENGNFRAYTMTLESKEFYAYFKKSFDKGKIIEITDEHNIWPNHYDKYLKKLYNDIEKDFHEHKDLNLLIEQNNIIKNNYDFKLRWNLIYYFVDILIANEVYEEAWEEWNSLKRSIQEKFGSMKFDEGDIKMIIKFEKLLNKNIIDGSHIYHIAEKQRQLTPFGKKNRHEIIEILSKILEANYTGSFFEQFYKDYCNINFKRKPYSFEYYSKYFEHSEYFRKFNGQVGSFDLDRFKLKNGNPTNGYVFFAIYSEASKLLREAENEYRLMIGAKRIGEGWISETELYYKIKSHFENLEVIHHGRPKWLGRQHFDIWIPELNIAVEYQGLQHDKPIEYFGGEEAYEKNVNRDIQKKNKCIANDCLLIEVRPEYNLDEIIFKIEERR